MEHHCFVTDSSSVVAVKSMTDSSQFRTASYTPSAVLTVRELETGENASR